MNGFFLIDKPTGISSAKIVSEIKKNFNIKKIGHAGTLDPLATGLLVLMLNRATKLFPLFLGEDKIYDVTLKFGEATDTYDSEGELTQKSETIPSLEELKRALKFFIGNIEQVVPAYSAVKRDGKPLYKLARAGKSIENLPKKIINIYDIKLLKYDLESRLASLKVFCSGGTYIRSLVHDLGIKLATFAHVTELRRLKTGFFDIKAAKSLDTLQELDILSLANFFKKNYSNKLMTVPDDKFLEILENRVEVDTSFVFTKESKEEFILYNKGFKIYL